MAEFIHFTTVCPELNGFLYLATFDLPLQSIFQAPNPVFQRRPISTPFPRNPMTIN